MFRKILSILLFSVSLIFSSCSFAYNVTNDNPDGNGSLSWGIQQANQGGDSVINVNSNIKTISLTRELTIEKDIVINGEGLTIEGDYNRRLFRVTSGRTVFNRITFMKGRAFSGNGGAVEIANDNASAEFNNCTFYDNRADNYGGAVSVTKGSEVNATVFRHCTIVKNLALNGGGVALIDGGMNLFSSIILGNTASIDIYASSTGSFRSRYNITGSANINLNADDKTGQTFSEVLKADIETVNGAKVFKLAGASPAIDFVPANANYTLSIDQTGNSRPQLSAYDAGAFENIPIAIQSVQIYGIPYIQINSEGNFSVDISPEDASLNIKDYPPAGVRWVSSNPSVLTVDNYGHVRAVGIGNALLTAEAYGWDENGNKIRKPANAYRVYVDETARQPIQAEISAIDNISMSPRSYKIITPEVKLSINGIELPNVKAGLDYTLIASPDRLDIAHVDIISSDSLQVMALDNEGSCDITVIARPIPTGEGMRETFTVEVTGNSSSNSNGGAGRSSGGGGCNSGALGLMGAIALFAFINININRKE